MRNIQKKKMCLGLVLLMLFAAMAGCGNPEKVPVKETDPVVTEPPRQLKENMQTILVMVTDNLDISEASGSYRNENRADFLLLLVVDEAAEKVSTLQLNPDTVIFFSLPGQSETLALPIGQVYSYGSGGSDSYLNICKVVSNMLDGVPVNHYLSFTMDAIEIVSDMLGGVSLVGSAEAETLQGAEAVSFFRTREEGDIANEAHMERQRQFMLGMYQPFMASAQNDDFLTNLTLRLGERMATDMTLSQMLPMFETLAAYGMEETVLAISGEAEVVDGEYQFHIDQAALDQVLDALVTQ